jgi:LysM repeat protein
MFGKGTGLLILSIAALLASCSVSRTAISPAKTNGSAGTYINNYKDIAISEMKRTGIPASITLAQGIIESDMGRSSLATQGNNHFGIKCHNDWKGPTIKHSDDRRNECFRKYRKPEESYRDHSDFLTHEPRYRSLFSLDPTDYKGWARGLKKAGYATNPDYAGMLIRKIEEYNLTYYDTAKPLARMEASKPVELNTGTSRIKERNRVQYIIVKDGDSKSSIEKEFNLLKWELARYNELQQDFDMKPGQIIYLQPKREKAEAGNEFHKAAEGETMYIISQLYGVRLKSLLNMNRMTEGQEVVAGQKIWLRSVKPVD